MPDKSNHFDYQPYLDGKIYLMLLGIHFSNLKAFQNRVRQWAWQYDRKVKVRKWDNETILLQFPLPLD